jgi:hypothetical protein
VADKGGPKDESDRRKKPPVVAITEEDLAKEWKASREETQKKYKGKRLEVSGVVYSADSNNPAELPMVTLLGAQEKKGKIDQQTTIHCRLPESDESKVDQLARNQKVIIRGVFSEISGGAPLLVDCELGEVGPSTAVEAKVDELVSTFKKDRKEGEKNYHQKSIVVEAKVAEIKWDGDKKRVTFILEGGPEARLPVTCECDFNKKLRPRLEAVKEGQTIKVNGEAAASAEYDSEIKLRDAKLLK